MLLLGTYHADPLLACFLPYWFLFHDLSSCTVEKIGQKNDIVNFSLKMTWKFLLQTPLKQS